MAANLSGGLGNRLFQFAAALGAAERWGREAVFFLPRMEKSQHGSFKTILKLFPSVRIVNTAPEWTEIKEFEREFYTYLPLPTTPPDGSVLLRGWRQSHKYFPSAGIHLNWEAALGTETMLRIQREARLETEEDRKQTIFLHVRLGDYLKLPHHQQQLLSYYETVLSTYVKPGQRILLFSDEPDRCRETFTELARTYSLRIEVAKVRSDVESLYEMSLCLGGAITANSTFSWWGAYLAHQRHPIWATYPSKWGQGQPLPQDLFPEWGTVVPV